MLPLMEPPRNTVPLPSQLTGEDQALGAMLTAPVARLPRARPSQ